MLIAESIGLPYRTPQHTLGFHLVLSLIGFNWILLGVGSIILNGEVSTVTSLSILAAVKAAGWSEPYLQTQAALVPCRGHSKAFKEVLHTPMLTISAYIVTRSS